MNRRHVVDTDVWSYPNSEPQVLYDVAIYDDGTVLVKNGESGPTVYESEDQFDAYIDSHGMDSQHHGRPCHLGSQLAADYGIVGQA